MDLRQRGAVALFGVGTAASIALSTLWVPDSTRAAIWRQRLAGILFTAFTLDAVLKRFLKTGFLSRSSEFTTAAIFVAASTVLSGGYIHHLFGCCRDGMQPNMTGAQ